MLWWLVANRNPAAVQYVIAKSEQGPYGVDSPYVDGTFSDDITGVVVVQGVVTCLYV